jgi:glycosyltransferase involved in cell wall biosynthesis
MGNDAQHAYMLPFALRFPGVLVLHDYVLHHLVAATTVARGDAGRYLLAMRDAHGRRGLRAALEVMFGRTTAPFFEYPLSAGFARRSRAVIVHSEFARKLIGRDVSGVPIHVLSLHVAQPAEGGQGAPLPALAARRSLGLPEHAYLLGSFGHATPSKRLGVALRAFRRLLPLVPDARFVVVGEVSPGYDLLEDIRGLGLERHVTVTQHVTMEKFERYLAAVDVCVNLRYPTAGETSASLLRMFAAAKPAIVSNVGWYAELPDDVCLKVVVDEAEDATIFAYLRLLHERPDLRRQIGLKAAERARSHHTVEGSAEHYARILRDAESVAISKEHVDLMVAAFWRGLFGRRAGDNGPAPASEMPALAAEEPLPGDLILDVGRALAELGITPDDEALLGAVAEALVSLRHPVANRDGRAG